ncbi:hypothetical protein B0H11DRAFT_2224954 [Mycena galericulata]|nr:hypothetical protein B0H11DRAFT_2224954 [Mycena galericulata]
MHTYIGLDLFEWLSQKNVAARSRGKDHLEFSWFEGENFNLGGNGSVADSESVSPIVGGSNSMGEAPKADFATRVDESEERGGGRRKPELAPVGSEFDARMTARPSGSSLIRAAMSDVSVNMSIHLTPWNQPSLLAQGLATRSA